MKTRLLSYGYILCFLFTGIFFCGYYNHHLLYVEQLQLFRLTRSYATSLLSEPGGPSAWLGEFLTQFYSVNYVGGLLVVAVLLIYYLLLKKLFRLWIPGCNTACCLLPVCAFALFFMDVHAQLGAAVAVTWAVGFVLGAGMIRNGRLRLAVSLLLIPVVYGCTGGGCLVYTGLLITGNLLSGKINLPFLLAAFLLGITVPLLTRIYILPMSWSETWLGNCFYRVDTLPGAIGFLLVWPVVVPFLLLALKKIPFVNQHRLVFTSFLSLFISFVLSGLFLFKMNRSEEIIYRLDALMKKNEWKEMIRVAENHPGRNRLFTSYVNLALLHENCLPQRLFSFTQYPGVNEFWTSAYLPMYLTGELYYQLGMFHAARAYVFMANTQSPGGLSPVMCKRLAEVEIIRGNAAAGLKFIRLLKHTLFYRRWAEAMEQSVLTGHYPEDMQRKIAAYTPGTAFLAKELLYNVAEQHKKVPEDGKVIDFLLARYMLANDYEGFIHTLSKTPGGMNRTHPRSYQEFLLMYAYMKHDNTLVGQWGIGQEVINDFYNYLQINQSGEPAEIIKKKLSDRYGRTYWYYAQYKNEL